MFTHLHVHTEYSLLDGLSRIGPLVQRTRELGMASLAITDHGALYGAIEFYTECQNAGIKPIIGCEVYVAQGSRHSKTPADKSPYHLTLLATDNTGYRNLIQLVTRAHLEGFYYKPRIDHELLEAHHKGLVALSGCPTGEIPRLLLEGREADAKRQALWYREVFGDFYLEIQRHEHVPDLDRVNSALVPMSRELDIPLVLTNDAHYVERRDAPIQDLLICIHTNTNVQDERRLRMEDDSFYVRSPDEMAALFPELQEAYQNTERIAEMCDLKLDFNQMHIPEYVPPGGISSEEYLKKLCLEGLHSRYPCAPAGYEERLRYEMEVIRQTQFANYFLVVWDIAVFARRQGILFGVRGSAAGSLALYCLGVTDIDPMDYRLVFERFLNLERKEMPDIDMDFQDDRRDEVIRYVSEKYGRDHVAQIITFGTLGPKAALRDTGRALGMPYADVDRVARLVPFRVRTLEEAKETVPELREIHEADEILRNLIDNAQRLEGVARHVSTHAAGVVISQEPLSEYVPLQRPVKGDDQGISMTQYPMEPIARLGLLKMDLLGLANLSILSKAIEIIAQHGGPQLDLHQIPLDDVKTFEMLSSGETTGVFQLEGSGMRRYIKELKPSSLRDVSAMIALYRPGPMEHIETFINAKHGSVEVKYLHPALQDILEETYGVIVYQDQVLLIVQAMAGYSLGEADIVRKAMGKKIAAVMAQERERFIQGAQAQGFSQELATEVFALIEPFAGYAFNKAHSVSYAVIAYWTAYFKANHPVEYLTALLSSYIGGNERVAVAVRECAHMKIRVLSPDINHSGVEFAIEADSEGGRAIRFGLTAIKNIGEGAVAALIKSREKHGPFDSLEELCRNADLSGLNRRALESLIKVGALDGLGPRGPLLASVSRLLSVAQRETQLQRSGQRTMFDLMGQSVQAPLAGIELVESEEVTQREKMAWERELLGVPLSASPVSAAVLSSNADAIMGPEELEEHVEQKVGLVGEVSQVTPRTRRDGKPFAVARLELLGGGIEVVAWPNVYERDREIWAERNLLLVEGKVKARDDGFTVYADEARLYTPPSDSEPAIEQGVETPREVPVESEATPSPVADMPLDTPLEMSEPAADVKGDGHGSQQPSPNGTDNESLHTVLINLADTGDTSADAFRLKSALQLMLEYPGADRVLVEIASEGRRVRLEMPLITTGFCTELEERLAGLIGPGRASVL